MTQIFIENNPVDIAESIPALLTFSIDDVKDFAARSTTFSKTIVLPGTARNNKVFGHIFDVRNANPYDEVLPNVNINFNAAKSARCVIFSDNIQTFKGSLRLLEIIVDNGAIEYEVAVFGELYGLVSAIGNGRLEDLDFSAYDHSFTYTAITGSWATYNAGSGYFYPLIDYGNYSTDKQNWQVGTFRPALYAREYLIKIFQAAGYTYDCALFDTERFKRLIVPYNRKDLTTLSTQVLGASRAGTYSAINSGTSTTVQLQYTTVVNTTFTASLSNSRFTYTPATPATLNVYMNISGDYISNGIGYSIGVRVNGVQVSGQLYTINPVAGTATYFYGTSFTFTQTFNQNDYIEIYLQATAAAFGTERLRVSNSNLQINSDNAISVPIDYGDFINLNESIPKNILQKDFLSSIVKLFNLYIYEDLNQDNHVKIAPYIDFYTGDEVDWTHKIDRSKPIRITPMASLNARFYDFKFKNDADYYNDLYQKRYNEGYGQYIFDSAFDFEDDRQTVELIFSPTPLVGYAGEDKVYSTILKLENGIESQIDSNIRLLQAKNVTGVTAWNISGVVSGLTNYGYAGHYDDPDAPSNDIHFGVPRELFFTLVSGDITVQQFNLYWSEYMAEITDKDSKLLTAYIKLNVTDIINLDFGAFVWIDGALWRLNKIEDYNISEPDLCKASFLKVIEKVY